jgi:hypothetical protein
MDAMTLPWFGRKLSEGRVVATRGEVGTRARVLAPGLHLLIAFLYRVKLHANSARCSTRNARPKTGVARWRTPTRRPICSP